ncbi:hypothetical protein AGRA3207_002065 [Actinomadura graeca]|uniref:Histidine kinase/HSP90-like ATPase domain-containing protein n=1 Tax=Actinomadura graeca TaxID=2750812 RepID=A0ABX8QR11_9ACTN|nr:ATP-binding protein [Actinomadura graeca]QXJ21230.1 hypothetical protein AGRA3207_002065 [Actinomadura graeca]
MTLIAFLVAGDVPHPAAVFAIMAVLCAWSGLYVRWLRRADGTRPWMTLLDAGVLAGLGLSAPLTVPAGWLADGRSWLLPLVAFACVGYQYYARPLVGAAAATIVVAAAITGTVRALPGGAPGDSLVTACWTGVVAVLARILWTLVDRGGRRADAMAAKAERARSQLLEQEGKQVAERDHNRSLHDNAAQTLLIVGTGQETGPPGLLAAEARANLKALHTWGENRPSRTDLMEGIRDLAGQYPLAVSAIGPPRLTLPPEVVLAFTDACREALRNVVKHAGVDRCEISVTGSSKRFQVDVVDTGHGFDPAKVPSVRRGLRGSIAGPVAMVGGSTAIGSAPGAGTRVTLRWSVDAQEAPRRSPGSPLMTEAEFLVGLRWAVVVIALTILGSFSMGRHLDAYRPLAVQATAYGVLLAIAAAEFVLILTRGRWGRMRWPAAALALGASAAACASLPPGGAGTAANWAFGTVGWLGVAVLLDRRFGWLIGFLAVHETINLTALLVSGGRDLDSVLNFAAGSITTIGFPFATGIAATVLRGVAERAEAQRKEAEAHSRAAKIEAVRHEVWQERYADLSVTVAPLLAGLAGGTLRPDDPEVQRLCWIEAARMRRLFAETDDVDSPLLHELAECVDIAVQKGVKAELKAHGDLGPIPREIRRALTEVPLAALAKAGTRARVTVIDAYGVVSVTVVSDCGPVRIPEQPEITVVVDDLVDENEFWVEATWRNPSSQQ